MCVCVCAPWKTKDPQKKIETHNRMIRLFFRDLTSQLTFTTNVIPMEGLRETGKRKRREGNREREDVVYALLGRRMVPKKRGTRPYVRPRPFHRLPSAELA